MLFMVIERFRDGDVLPIYKRVRDEGRLLPDGLRYVDSWVEANFGRCFQLMECEDLRLLQEWVLKWRGAGVSFEIVPVVSSDETRKIVAHAARMLEGMKTGWTQSIDRLGEQVTRMRAVAWPSRDALTRGSSS